MNFDQDDSKIDDVKKLAQEAEKAADDSGIAIPGAKAGKKRGKYKKREKTASATSEEKQDQAPPEKGPEIPTSAILKPVLKVGSTGLAARLEIPEAQMRPDELEAASQALGMLIDKYLPNVLEKYGVEVMCLFVFSQYGFRVSQLVVEKRIRENQAAKATQEFSQKHDAFDPPPQSKNSFAERDVSP